MIFLRRQLPLLITMITGLIFAAQYYVPHPASEQLLTSATKWLQIIGGFALVLGVTSLFHVHAAKIRRKEAGWGYSVVLYAGMLGTMAAGLWANGKESVDGVSTAFGWVYNFMMVPLQGTMFAILAFFIASAAYRSFRARSREAAVLLIAAVLGSIYTGIATATEAAGVGAVAQATESQRIVRDPAVGHAVGAQAVHFRQPELQRMEAEGVGDLDEIAVDAPDRALRSEEFGLQFRGLSTNMSEFESSLPIGPGDLNVIPLGIAHSVLCQEDFLRTVWYSKIPWDVATDVTKHAFESTWEIKTTTIKKAAWQQASAAE